METGESAAFCGAQRCRRAQAHGAAYQFSGKTGAEILRDVGAPASMAMAQYPCAAPG
jgi:hypothetical protein